MPENNFRGDPNNIVVGGHVKKRGRGLKRNKQQQFREEFRSLV
jgi:hypothetical protein